MKCQYKDCEAEAKFSLGMADPDAELNYYCSRHIDKVKREAMIDLFTRDSRCKVITKRGKQCLNSKKFGDLCGIHSKHNRGMGDLCGYCEQEINREHWIATESCLSCGKFLDNPPFIVMKSKEDGEL